MYVHTKDSLFYTALLLSYCLFVLVIQQIALFKGPRDRNSALHHGSQLVDNRDCPHQTKDSTHLWFQCTKAEEERRCYQCEIWFDGRVSKACDLERGNCYLHHRQEHCYIRKQRCKSNKVEVTTSISYIWIFEMIYRNHQHLPRQKYCYC